MKKLLFSITKKDLDIQTFCSGGPGGQHQNKVATGVRIVHRESGAVGEARDTRSQHHNMKEAFKRMAESKTFQTWTKLRAIEMMGNKTIEERVEEQLTPDKLRVECKDDSGKWTKTCEELQSN